MRSSRPGLPLPLDTIYFNGVLNDLSQSIVELRDDIRRQAEDDDYNKRVYLGGELRLPKVLSARLGYSQRYVTAGVTADLWIIRLDYATYAEEVGVYAGQRDDRRHVFMISFGL